MHFTCADPVLLEYSHGYGWAAPWENMFWDISAQQRPLLTCTSSIRFRTELLDIVEYIPITSDNVIFQPRSIDFFLFL